MLFVCTMLLLFLLSIFANAFCFHALSLFIDTLFVYFKYDIPSCAVLLMFLFTNTMFTPFFLCEKAMCSLEK